MNSLSKKALKAQLLKILEANLATLEAAHAAAIEGATHEEAKPENDKDTRALEQSYLARGQAMRIEALKAGLAALNSMNLALGPVIRLGALVEVDDEEGVRLSYFIAAEGGGTKLDGNVQVLTPTAPLGAALMGKREGDELELTLNRKVRYLSIAGVS